MDSLVIMDGSCRIQSWSSLNVRRHLNVSIISPSFPIYIQVDSLLKLIYTSRCFYVDIFVCIIYLNPFYVSVHWHIIHLFLERVVQILNGKSTHCPREMNVSSLWIFLRKRKWEKKNIRLGVQRGGKDLGGIIGWGIHAKIRCLKISIKNKRTMEARKRIKQKKKPYIWLIGHSHPWITQLYSKWSGV